jgi:hypothetical protein
MADDTDDIFPQILDKKRQGAKQRSIAEVLANDLAAGAKTPAIRWIARRFAVIKLALDLACAWDILPWEPSDN